MYARSTTIQARRESIDDGIVHIRDVVMPAVLRIHGCMGLSLLVDRESGRCIATTSWQTEQDMHASEQTIRLVRNKAAQSFGGSPQVDEWEIAVLHRDHHSGSGACVRASWLQVDPAGIDRLIDVYKTTSLPSIEDLEGFCSASLLVDHASGRAVSTVVYDSIEAMRRNRERASTIRSTGTQQAGAKILDVLECELALAHLRVPEMA